MRINRKNAFGKTWMVPIFTIGLATAILPAGAAAQGGPVRLTIKDHRFTPAEVTVPAGERMKIEITNLDSTPEEFESGDLKVEKIIVPGGKIVVTVGPLKARTYKFFGDYHPETATGTLTAIEKTGKE
jgi:hypothetical protein